MRMSGLNFEAIPELSAPMRFYLTAPVFALLAAILVISFGEQVWLSRWMPVTLAATHLLALGVMAMVMIGSLFQVMPVLCGAAIPIRGWKLHLFHLLLVAGVVSLSSGFLGWVSFSLSFALLGLSLGYFVFSLLRVLFWEAKGQQTRLPISLAVLALAVLLVLGLILLSGYLWGVAPGIGKSLTNLHAGIGLFGWIMLLIMAVSFQVIPMFHVTPNFSSGWRYGLIGLLVIGIVIVSLESFGVPLPGGWLLCIVASILYSVLTLERLGKRKRKLPDVVINYWKCGLISLLLACLLLFGFTLPLDLQPWPADWQTKLEVFIGLLFGLGFVLAIIQGMLLKIVPFLITLHLQRAMMRNPMAMIPLPDHYQLISRVHMKWQFHLYIAVMLSLVLSFMMPSTTAIMALLFALNWAMIGYNILGALKQYRICLVNLQSSFEQFKK